MHSKVTFWVSAVGRMTTEIYPNVLLTGDVFCTEREFMSSYLHSPAKVQLLLQLQIHLFSEQTVSSGQEASILVLVAGSA